MSNLLYYPYINLPKTDWTLRTLLYYDNIGAIVPQEYFYAPERNYEPFMLELIRNELVTPINPIDELRSPWNITRPFVEMVSNNTTLLDRARINFRNCGQLGNNNGSLAVRIHSEKFDSRVFHELEDLGVAERGQRNWFNVETKIADSLMRFLATIVSIKTQRTPVTDYVKPHYYRSAFDQQNTKRETILANLIPFPAEINLSQLMRFKQKHSNLLESFRNRVELLVLDPNVTEGSMLYHAHLSELLQRKEELSAKMNESRFNSILFGTVCGLIGAYQGLSASSNTSGALLGALPGFASAVYSAMKIEQPENVYDQTGLKYLALAEKRLKTRSSRG